MELVEASAEAPECILGPRCRYTGLLELEAATLVAPSAANVEAGGASAGASSGSGSSSKVSSAVDAAKARSKASSKESAPMPATSAAPNPIRINSWFHDALLIVCNVFSHLMGLYVGL